MTKQNIYENGFKYPVVAVRPRISSFDSSNRKNKTVVDGTENEHTSGDGFD